MTVVYEDNHIIIVNKTASEIVQGDKTGDIPLSETVKQYLKEKYSKPGNVFLRRSTSSGPTCKRTGGFFGLKPSKAFGSSERYVSQQ